MASSIRGLTLTPVLTASALYVLTRGPPSLQQPLLTKLLTYISPRTLSRLITGLKVLLGASLLKTLNLSLSAWAGNNFTLFSSTKGWDWPNEIAVVTGGSSGFGALFTADLTAKGIKVVVLDINPLPAHLASNPLVTFHQCDVTSRVAVLEVGDKIRAELGDATILINNAGMGAGKSILGTDDAFLARIFGVNLFSHYYTVQAFLPAMLKHKKGHIVNIASIASFVAPATIIDYAATKAGALVFHEGLRSELRTLHHCPEIKTSIIHPSWADTPLIAPGKAHLQKAGEKILDPQDVSDAVVAQILNGRSGQIVLAGSGVKATLISGLRGMPGWWQEMIGRLTEDKSHKVTEKGVDSWKTA
ncbi:hypothetical protein AAFC00_004239 [Neodothiora populina]|uniref:NAD(P)-binding protein n=1 Tax=Neodothiora populina TaxID=2781224 RepID=A0ABR3PJ88_9PEZI